MITILRSLFPVRDSPLPSGQRVVSPENLLLPECLCSAPRSAYLSDTALVMVTLGGDCTYLHLM